MLISKHFGLYLGARIYNGLLEENRCDPDYDLAGTDTLFPDSPDVWLCLIDTVEVKVRSYKSPGTWPKYAQRGPEISSQRPSHKQPIKTGDLNHHGRLTLTSH